MLGQIAVEHESQNVVLVFGGVHVASQLVGHRPKLGSSRFESVAHNMSVLLIRTSAEAVLFSAVEGGKAYADEER
jgi:hypothetical protein